MTDKPPANMKPIMYTFRVHELQTICNSCGYALALHGSMENDLDAIAVPWTNKAESAGDLVDIITSKMSLTIAESSPTEKLHGRKVWTLLLEGQGFIDLSVMTRADDEGPIIRALKEAIVFTENLNKVNRHVEIILEPKLMGITVSGKHQKGLSDYHEGCMYQDIPDKLKGVINRVYKSVDG